MGTTTKVEELEKKVQRLEAAHAELRKEMSMFTCSAAAPPPSPPPPPVVRCNFTERDYLNILESMGQTVHIIGLDSHVLYWNSFAESLFGYSAAEAIGRHVCELLVSYRDAALAEVIIRLVNVGQSWEGLFPVRDKMGQKFTVVVSNTPLYDDDGTLIGTVCVSCDTRPFRDVPVSISDPEQEETGQDFSRPQSRHSLNPDQPLRTAIASKITNLASKVSNNVRSKMKTVESNVFRESEHGDNGLFDAAPSSRGNLTGVAVDFFSSFAASKSRAHSHGESNGEGEGKPSIHGTMTSRAETWIGKKAIRWPWKGTEHESCEPQSVRPGCSCVQSEQDSNQAHPAVKSQIPISYYNKPVANEALGSRSSYNVSSSSSASSCGSGSSISTQKLDTESDCLNYEITWEDLTIGEQIGQGSCGTVYHGIWYGSDVAIKVFSKQEYSEEVIFSFRQEVSLMKQLRHPNILLFMGAVTSPQRLCIVTEFLPRGSLFLLLQRNTYKLDWRRKLNMALDIVGILARGMNYLHNCSPPIVHRDLKSSNLLVDKNWGVKVADFGLSRVKHETYLATKTGKGTPQWMAPEALQNGPSNEKSDLYSFGVILWELATQKIPWENLNAMQVIGAVGFMDERLDIPEDIDPEWASMIRSCWRSEPQSRPTFQELVEKLKKMLKQHGMQFHAARAASVAAPHKQLDSIFTSKPC